VSEASGIAPVRRADPERASDLAAVADLRFTWRHDEGGESGTLADFAPAFAGWWLEHRETHRCWLAEVDGAAVGMAWLAVLERVPGPERFRRQSGALQSVYVRPEHRGRGLGAALVSAVLDHARAEGLDYVGVHPSERSYPLYERAGFHRTPAVLELGLTRPRPRG
jgi:GNAT superfamily N-acetyltransferase